MTAATIAAGTHWVEVPCPRCGALEIIGVTLHGLLQIPTDDAPTLRVRSKSAPIAHNCGQQTLSTADLYPTEAKP